MGRREKAQFIVFLNSLSLLVICMILFTAFLFQLMDHQVPCPLCLLQRVGLILAGFGFYFNIRHEFRNSHYALTTMACILTGAVATRQILLHIRPGDPGYSTKFLGFHFYTWSLITTILIIFIVSGIMVLSDLSEELFFPRFLKKINKYISYGVCIAFDIIVTISLILTFLECGFGQCLDNPMTYFYILH